MRIVTIVGTSRPGNYTSKALTIVQHELGQTDGVEVVALDAAKMSLGFPGIAGDYPDREALQATVKGADGVILATPEYHGTFAAMMKLVIENLGFPSMLAGKPVALLGVAGGAIGAVKSLEQLRGVCAHVGAIVLPGPVSVAGVQKAFDKDGSCQDERVEKRLRGLSHKLTDYIEKSTCPKQCLEEMVREE